MAYRRPYQFTIRRLLLLSTAIAAVWLLSRGLHAAPLVQIVAGIYFSLLAIWAVMRWPVIRGNLREVRERRRAIADRRRAMTAEAARAGEREHDD